MCLTECEDLNLSKSKDNLRINIRSLSDESFSAHCNSFSLRFANRLL